MPSPGYPRAEFSRICAGLAGDVGFLDLRPTLLCFRTRGLAGGTHMVPALLV